MKKITLLLIFVLTLTLSLSSMQALAVPKTKTAQKLDYALALLSQPYTKIQRCAQMGVIGYQNTLSAYYLVGHPPLRKNTVIAYAWGYIAYQQTLLTKNKRLIKNQAKTLTYLQQDLTTAQIKQGQALAKQYQQAYGKNWPKPPILSMAQLPKQCQLKIEPVFQPQTTKPLP